MSKLDVELFDSRFEQTRHSDKRAVDNRGYTVYMYATVAKYTHIKYSRTFPDFNA
jgi:hypothetical protein